MTATADTSLKRLTDDQLAAVETADHIWLGASAGTGKTQVLAARVVRLLLEPDVHPENLLCITYTKAGAAEMAERVNGLLASWVQKDDKLLFNDLEAIGAQATPEMRQRARQLFASVLDAPGGGLQIMTIHSLCQSLLASFPEEAGLIPGFKPIEGREQSELYREALSEMIIAAESSGNDWVVGNLQTLSLALDEDAAQSFLQRCAASPDALADLPDGQGLVMAIRLRLLGLDYTGSSEEYLREQLSDAAIDSDTIRFLADMNSEWNTKTGIERAETVGSWLLKDIDGRIADFDKLRRCWTKADGDFMSGLSPKTDGYIDLALELYNWTKGVQNQRLLLDYADRWAAALSVGKAYAAQYEISKHARGVVDFNDMIRKTAELLEQADMAEWIRYKLDQRIDHILVDEAQDSNSAQWQIVKALSDDFFSGDAAKAGKLRTIFAVGDYKQAIYGFQGTDPEKYVAASADFRERIEAAGERLEERTLSQSFRSNAPILRLVNAVIENGGGEAMGISAPIEPHYSERPDIGLVELFAPISAGGNEGSDEDEEAGDNWVSDDKRELARRIAEHIRALLDEAPILQSTGKPLRPGDIMILLRARSSLASALVSQLHQQNVEVAGVDRLRLLQPLAVQDLLSAIRFVLQPDDDYSLACLMVSPLIGWTQEQLLEHGYRGPNSGKSLWRHLREHQAAQDAIAPLRDLLDKADFTTAYIFLENILSGPMQGRRKLLGRLGSEALVPAEEFLNAALQFEQNEGGTLQDFLAWFERDDSEIKREGVAGNDEVRVITVHGAKGLQAPVVILADAAADPNAGRKDSIDLVTDSGRQLPLLRFAKDLRIGKLGEAAEYRDRRELNEFNRLLYVALTRAQERLIVTGSLGRNRKEIAELSWYATVQSAMEALGCEWADDHRWGRAVRFIGGDGDIGAAKVDKAVIAQSSQIVDLPTWLFTPAPDEQRPPRPLVPSRLADDDFGDAPASLSMRAAAERGKLIHALFERIDGSASLDKAARWLGRQMRHDTPGQETMLAHVRAVVENPDWRDFFGPNARAEVPLAAIVGEMVISGRIDRLIIEPGRVRILDFKTGRSVPRDETQVPVPYLRQMASYVAALGEIFPGAMVEAALLFTHEPRLIALSDEILSPHKPAS